MNEVVLPRRDDNRRGGFTLIEVVIALAIFLFGAVAIIRIFPPALGVIQNSGDRLTALNFNRTTLARYAKESSALPYAIYNNNFNATTLANPSAFLQPVDFAGSTVGTATRNNAIPRSNVQGTAGSSLNQFNLVSGEKQRVRSININGNPLLYVVTSFPVAGPEISKTRPPLARVYREVTITGVTTQTKTLTGNQSGFLDFSNASPLPPTATTDLLYYVSYRYLENGQLNGTNDEAVRSTLGPGTPTITATAPILNVANLDVQVLQGRRLASPNGVVDGPVQVRYRQPLNAPSFEPADVGTSEVNIQRQNTRNNLGILILTGVTAGEEVSIDYQINSWNQIVDNSLPSVVPEATPTPGPNPLPLTPPKPREVVLPIHFMADGRDGSGDLTYSLLSYLNAAGTASFLEANAMNSKDELKNPNQFTLLGINRKAGRVLFDISDHAVGNPQDYTVLNSRVVYQTRDDWNHQVSVAPTNYTPFYSKIINGDTVTNSTAPQPWRYYYWDRSNQQGRIYFPPSEAGKTISLSYSYDPLAPPTAPVKVEGGVVTINERWIPAAQAPTAAQELAMVDQNDPDKGKWLAVAEPKPTNTGPLPLVAIRSIKGVSVQARTAWLDGDKFNQVSTVGFRGDSN
ncbi:prepilin-type N-terminal cleavage/methylation domain-containing protein [Abditibacterium utsteinense]|uniref:Prepilin-type N-terminal cleavage/methylation domain-containing protein n=1 Tax=Abditibacterium utsteinense TaxID=1960156 RepID=A0A2S8SVV5_9BACT|nr:prepilin-type N-terminal cleavage/methylation domain-containing protein [Abditibacterium utsteinense]PQV64925.1 prepilin-type N-terminal cleavage/methylation domain-containing protein [Abditibacterium utsteinense]